MQFHRTFEAKWNSTFLQIILTEFAYFTFRAIWLVSAVAFADYLTSEKQYLTAVFSRYNSSKLRKIVNVKKPNNELFMLSNFSNESKLNSKSSDGKD